MSEEQIPFLVLLDEDGAAARAASLAKASLMSIAGPAVWAGTRRAWKGGHRQHKPGKRVTQLGATFVIGPAGRLRYQHLESDPSDHAPLGDVLARFRGSAGLAARLRRVRPIGQAVRVSGIAWRPFVLGRDRMDASAGAFLVIGLVADIVVGRSGIRHGGRLPPGAARKPASPAPRGGWCDEFGAPPSSCPM